MKKIIICLLTFLSAGLSVQAQTVTVADVEVLSSGETVQFALHVSGVTAMTSTHFEIAVPSGFMINGASSSSDWPTMISRNGGIVSCISSSDKAMNGEGDVAILSLTVAEGTPVGVYTATVGNIRVNGANLNAPVSFNIIVVEKHAVVLDENSTTAPAASDGEVSITVKRSIKANEWSTICLPFSMTGSEVTRAFGNDVRLMDFDSYDATYDDGDNVSQISVAFSDVDISGGIEANHPYIIKTSADVSEFTATSTIEPDEENAVIEYDNGLTGKRRQVYGWFSGCYTAQKVLENNTIFLSGNKFWYSNGLTKMKAYRAYFDFVDVLSDVENAQARISFGFENITTGITQLEKKEPSGMIYSLGGIRLGNRLSRLPKGIYIVDGKKRIVK